ncbi:TPA: hypothetical protein ACX6QE_003665 [Photobacterium damselae]
MANNVDIIDILKAKEIDIYISLFMTILGTVLGVITNLINDKSRVKSNDIYSQNITINNFTNRHYAKPSNESDQFFLFFLICFGLLYSFFRIEILNLIFYTAIFIVSIWSGRIVFNLFTGYFSGFGWIINIIFYILIFISAFYIINIAITPVYAPQNFQYLQYIINEFGIKGVFKYFSMKDIQWFILHIFGIFVLFSAIIRLLLSIVFFTIIGSYDTTNCNSNWLALKTAKYANPWKNIIFISVCLFFSYYLVSGYLFIWCENELPNISNELFNTILNGK